MPSNKEMQKPITMNRPTLQFVVLFLLFSITGIAQTYKPFSIRKNIELKGNMVVVGNSILGQDNLPFNDLSKDNQDISMQYIDIDGISSTFSSSSADVIIPDQPDGSATTCYRVAYAGLYWSAILQNGDRSTINQIKFKTPTNTVYHDVVGEIVYDAIIDPIPSFSGEPANTPYACYADVTNLLTDLSNLEGTYTVANVTSSQGSNFSTGLAAGWTLLVIYENPNLETKSFTTFDGFSHIYDSHTEDIPISGFNTPPSGSIDIQMAYAALDGDRSKRASKLEIDGRQVTSSARPANKFFGSVIENSDGVAHPRNPFSSNTLGYDTGFLEIKNAEPEYIKNGDTSSGFTLQVPKGQADPVFTFLNSFAVDVIAPDIVLTKIVTDDTGTEIDGADVVLGQRLFYEITYQSIGNDNAVDFTLKDVLPDNIFFDPTTDIDLSNAGGSTLQSYNAVTRTLIFNIPNGSVEVGDPKFVIRLATQVVSYCYDLSQACSNEITNQAFASYSGVINNALVVDEGSFATTECFGVPGTTNFLVDITKCNFQRDQVLCGASVDLIAADGYDSYSWSTSSTGTPVVGTGQTFTAVNTGTYYVKNTTLSTCTSINEEITVIPYGNTLTNPIIPFADEVNICPNDGKSLPDIYLCGVNATRAINTGIADAVSIIWEKLDESSCSAVGIDNCANENSSCVWNQIATGPNYVSDTSGQFRIVINYPGGCFSIYYFNVYANLLAPTISSRDIICNTQGQVTAGGFPTDYQYSLDPMGPYQSSNVFAISSPGYYTIYSKQVGVDSSPCIFETPNIYVRLRDVSITSNVSQPLCFGDKGTISVAVNDGLPQYNYNIYLGATLVNSVGPTVQSDYTFANLNAGTYTVNVSTDDGCTFSEDIEIIEPAALKATSALTRPLTCTNGEITVYPIGGTPPYLYYVNSTTDFQNTPFIPVQTSDVYNITVVDSNNCSVQTSITVDAIPEPVFDVIETNILCYGSNTGQIQFNLTNANGYAIEYSIDNGVTYETNSVFSNLFPGTYQTIIKYSLNGIACFSAPQDIIINEPVAAVTATAGVSELAGCGPSGAGTVRITNPQGGVAPYEYSFDNQATWTSTNQDYLTPGTYTLYIKDANNCIFPMPSVTVDPEPVAPTIDVSDPNFNCDGSANSTVTITNPGSNAFDYTYLIDGIENPNTADPTTFLNVPDGSHTVSVKYQLLTVPTYSNLLNETFGYGEDTSSPGMNPVYYCFERQVAATQCKNNIRIQDGDYSVTASIVRPYGPWINPIDHTPTTGPPIAKGRYLVVNIGATIPASEILYEKQINDIIQNQPINVEFFAMNLLKSGNTQANADLRVALVDASGTEISSFSTGGIPKSNTWENYAVSLNPGANTSLKFIVRSNVQLTSGNDVAIDDIRVYQLPAACITQVDFPIIIGTENAFDASIVSATDVTCFGANDGTITVSAQNFDTVNGFQYSLDGTTWVTQMTSPHTITGLPVGNQNIQIRYEDAVDTCVFPFNQNIATPTPVEVTASATAITCLNGATVRATGSGGTPAYSYELLDTALNLISNFPSNGVLTNVGLGDYIVRVTDANDCTETTTLNLADPIPPIATIVNADYCYDAANGAALEVSASGGQAPYQYNINGGAFKSTPRFTNLIPGNYIIIVRDAYGCEFPLPSETIAPQVAISTVLTKELDCTLTPNAVITGTISNGYPDAGSNYEYALSFNGNPFTDLGTIGTSFTYDAVDSGTYQFQVIDDNNCQILSDVVTVRPVVLPTATTNVVNPLCNGEANGSVQIIPASGVGPYEFSFDGSTFSTTSSYPGLAAGTYVYQIKDSKACIFDGTVTLTNPSVLAVTASATAFSCNAANGKQSAQVIIDVPTTGTGPYTYSFDGGTNFSSSKTLTLNDDGTDQIIDYAVKDANGCTDGGSLTVNQLNPPTDLEISATAITCDNTTSTATITSTINGVTPLQYETIAPSPVIVPKQTSNIFTGLTDGTYLFRVTDANGCYYTESLTIKPVTEIVTVGQVGSHVSCNGENNGIVGFRVSRFSSSYSYIFDSEPVVPSHTGALITKFGLSAGDHTITVTDETTGCSATTTVTVTEPANALTINLTSNVRANCNNSNAIVTVNIDAVNIGTPGNYTYAFVEDGVTPSNTDYTPNNIANLNPITNSNWDVYAKDINGCSDKLDVSIETAPLPSIDDIIITDQCTGTTTTGFTVNTTASGGVGTLEFSIGGAYNTTGIFTSIPSGTYTLTIKDANNCVETQAFTIDEPLTTQANLTKDLTCDPSPTDATILITASNGNGPYTYAVTTAPATYTGGLAGNLFTTDTSGTYGFTITDTNSCSRVTNTVIIAPIINPDIASVSIITPITCNGDLATVQVNYDTTLGVTPFTFSYTNTTATLTGSNTTGVFNLPADDYTFTITDNKGCTDIEPLNITEPAVINAAVIGNPITCSSVLGVPTSLGSVEITNVTGGTGPYDYYVTGPGYMNSEMDNAGISPFVFDVINFGIYQVNVIDANGCTLLRSDVVVASAPDDLDIDVTSLPVDCAASSASAIVSIGTGTITSDGPFYFAIYDGSVPNYPTPLTTPWLAETIPGSPGFPGSKFAQFDNLIPGVTYTFIVYDSDGSSGDGGLGSGCYYYETATQPVNSSSTLDIALTPSNNFTCTGSSSGNVNFDITSIYPGDVDITYEILDALTLAVVETAVANTLLASSTLTIPNFGNLPFGDYIVLVRETTGSNMGCSISSNRFNIAESAVPVDVVASLVKDETCNDSGIVTATGSNGTGPYEFIISTSATPPAITDTSWDTISNFPVAAGTYYVHIKDAFNCIATSLPVIVDIDPEPVIALSTIDTCADEGSFSIEVNLPTAGIANYALQLDSNAAINISSFPYTFNNLNSGNHTVTITDANGCIDVENITLVKKLSINPVVTKELDCTVSPDAEITLNLSDGTSSFTYLVEIDGIGGFNPATITSGVYTATAPGSYIFRVTDSNSCQFTSLPIVVEPITNPVIDSNPIEIPSCPLSTDGTVTINASGGEPALAGYTFTVTQTLPIVGTPIVQIGNNYFTGLEAGTYSIEVRDAKSCYVTGTFIITDPIPLAFDAPTVDAFSCSSTNAPQLAKVTINVTSGTGTAPYKYNFDGGTVYYETNELIVIDNGLDQPINYYVQDSKGCTANGSIVVTALNPPSDLDFDATPVTCTNLDSEVTLTPTGGVGTLTYEIIAPASATTNTTGDANGIYTGLLPDTYTFSVTDANGCFYTESYTVQPVTNITVRGALFQDASCKGESDGAVGFKVDNFSSEYSYQFNTDPVVSPYDKQTLLFAGLTAGVHTLTVTDNITGCIATTSVTVAEPTDDLTIDSAIPTKVHCNMYNSFITVTASGGTPNYKYAAVVSGSAAPNPSDYVSNNVLSVDTNSGNDLVWEVYVDDTKGCIGILTPTTVNIDLDESPSVTVPTDAVCSGTTSGFEFTATNTTGPLGEGSYEFSIGNGFQTSPTFTVTTPGDYTVTIKDGNGCEADSGTITVHPALDISPTVTTLPSCLTNDGVITVTGSGGSGLANYNYTISPSGGTTQTATEFSGLAASTLYTVTITDGITNCTKDATITLEAPTPVDLDAPVVTPTSCNSVSDGSISVNLAAGNDNPIYLYSLDGGTTTQTSNVFSGLPAGTYNITVTSGRNCVATQTLIEVEEPDAITIPNPTIEEYICTTDTNTNNFATITVNGVTGGSLNYTIYEFIKGGATVQANASNVYTEADLSGGVYTINIYDDKGCFETTTATIQPFIRLDTLDVTIDNAMTCTNDEDITVSVTSTGGSPTNLEYTAEDVDGAIIGAVYSQTNATGIFTSLPIGDYIISVVNTDTGCNLQTVHYVNEPNTFDITIDNVIDVTCFSDSNGSIDVTLIDRIPTPTDESGPFTYTIVDVQGNPVTSGTAANAGPITIPGFASGTYTLTASLISSPFCTITKNFTITAPTQALSIAETHTEITCISGNNDGSISATAAGGWIGGYEFQLELTAGGIITPFSNISNFSGLTAGDYTLTIRDSKGCIVSTNILLENPLPITADIIAIPSTVLCFGDANSSIELSNVQGGQGSNYTFTLNVISPVVTSSGPQTSPNFSGLGAGTYNVLIQDGYSCEFTTADVIITEPSTVDALLIQTTNETCTSGSTMILSATGGTPPYEYSDNLSFTNVIGGFTTNTTIITFPSTSSITYKYYVRDANGCISGVSNEITIDPLAPLMVDIDATNAFINCTGDTTGVIVANAQGGLGNYTYILQDGSGTDVLPAPTQNSPGVFTDLPAGTYQVRVTSGIDCADVSMQVSITEPEFALQTAFNTTDVTCAGGENGSIEIIATGGSGVIKYAISPQLNQFFESPIFEDLAVGTYQIVVQDELGCFVVIDFTIDEPTPVMLSIVPNSIVPEVCQGDLDGAFSVDILGGTLPYSYNLGDISGPYISGGLTQTQFDFDNLSGGDHVVYVRDAAGCESEWNITLPESVLLDPQVSIEYGCTSNLSTNTVTVSVDSGISNLADVDYSLDGSPFQASNVFTDVPSGIDHTITVRHTNGCEKLSPDFDIDHIEPLDLLVGDGQLNEIVAEVSGGVGPYEYTVNGEDFGNEEKYFIYSSGDYTVNVTDAKGCVSAVTRYFEYIDVCISNYFTPNGDGTLDEWGPGCTTQYNDLSVRVFDRYGRQIALLMVNEKWDGNYNGKSLPSGDYWYILKLNDPKDDREFIGHFTLYR